MTRASLVSSLVLSLLGCSDPSLKIVYAIEDAALAEQVDRVTVELYLPGGFDCSALAFGLITPTPSLQIDLQESSAELATIPRTGTKLFVLRGYGLGSEEPSIAGCAEVETIESEEEVRIVAEPVTLATVEGGSFGLTEDRTVDFNRWQVQIQDLLSRPQPQIAVRWEAFGAGMLEPMTGQAIAAPGQQLGPIITLPQQPAPGPLRMTVRARWGLGSSTALSFVPPVETRFSLSGVKADFAVVDSPRLLVSVVQTSTATTEIAAFHPDGDRIERASSSIAGAWILGQTSASTFLLSGDQVRRVSALADGSVQLAASAPFPPGQAVEVVDLSGCDPARADPLGVALLAAGGQQIFDGTFSPVSLPGLAEAGRIEASGCVPMRDGPEARLLWSGGESRQLSFLSEERIQTLPLDPRIVSLAFGGRWTDAANVAITTSVVDGTTEISVRPDFTANDGLLIESPDTLLGAAAAMDAADVDDNGTLDLVVVTRIDSVRHALYIIVTGDRASAGAGLVLRDRLIEPWLAVVAFPGRVAPVIVVGDRREGRDVEERGLLFLSMER